MKKIQASLDLCNTTIEFQHTNYALNLTQTAILHEKTAHKLLKISYNVLAQNLKQFPFTFRFLLLQLMVTFFEDFHYD